MIESVNEQLQLAANYINYTDCNLFLTGKAGTGKTTFLRNLSTITHKRMVVVAPTGVAAINAKGVTINSFFQIAFGIQLPNFYINNKGEKPTIDFSKYRKERKAIIKSLDLLVIDEISMVRADVLDSIDLVLRQFRRRDLPFGGVQLLMIGDMSQLEPIAKDEEWQILKQYYKTKFFFSSLALTQTGFVSIELQKIYRQVDNHFIQILNKVRNNQVDEQTLNQLNQRYIPNFQPPAGENYITLTTHNNFAIGLNDKKLKELDESTHKYTAKVTGEFSENIYPTLFELELKVGAQVMFIKNDSSPDKLYFNGKIGEVIKIKDDNILVKCAGDYSPIEVKKEKWDNIKYTLDADTKEITEDVIGTFTQIPLKLAWAITIHKSQGLTFEKAIIDASQSFSFGQVYVALSRCKSLEGMVLSAPISASNIMSSPIIQDFSTFVEQHQPTKENLFGHIIYYQEKLVYELFNFALLKQQVTKLTNTALAHQSAIPKHYSNIFLQMESDFASQIVDVSEKFIKQIASLRLETKPVEENEILQDRITKSVPYFTVKLKDIVIDPLASFVVDIDNKAVKDLIEKDIQNLFLNANIKEKSLQSAEQGFKLNDYLKARALSSIDDTLEKDEPKIKKHSSISNSNAQNEHPKLYHELRKYINQQAESEKKISYQIFDKKTTEAICDHLPQSLKELERIKGIGKVKVAQYGDDIIEIVNSYLSENSDLTKKEFTEVEEVVKVKKEGSNTKQESFKLFEQGLTIEAIAAERGYVAATILGHLLHFVQTGELEPSKLVEQSKLDEIGEILLNNSDKSLTELKEMTEDKYSYNELRIAKTALRQRDPA